MLTRSPDGLVTSPAALVWARRGVALPVVVEDGGPTWTWAAMARAAALVADRLGELAGEPVVVSARNGGALVAGIFGIWLAGGIPAPVSPKLPAPERAKMLASIGSAAVCATAASGFEPDLLLDDTELLAAPPVGDRVLPRLEPTAPGIVLCTSGTTGLPKAIVHSVRGVWALIDQVTNKPVDPDDLPVPLDGPAQRIEPKPMTHVGALYGLMFDLWRGRSMIVMQRFEPIRYADLVRANAIATISVVPSMLRMLLDTEVGELSPPAKLATTGTAALPESWRTEFEQRFGIPIQLTYGQTESAGAIAFEPLSDVLGGTRRIGSSGRVVPRVTVQIRDDAGTPLPVGEVGRIWITGDGISPSIRGATTSTLVDGWLDTGDLGRLDADDYIYLTGRTRDLIIRGGLKITPAEVEAALLEHPSVGDAAVAARPDERLGEVPVAWVRPSGPAPTSADLQAFLRERMAAYKVPVAFHFVDDFPRTESGKIRKADLVDAPS